MTTPDSDDRARSYASPPRRRRRYSIWTLLAPAAVVILWISFFSALGQSCVFKECADAKDDSAEVDEGDEKNTLPRGANTRVKTGENMGLIAARFKLTEEELKACNPTVDPQTIQPGDLLIVSAVDCEDADKAEVGANPDPLAGDTTAGGDEAAATTTTPAPAENGTAAADPSVDAEQSAEQGDEG